MSQLPVTERIDEIVKLDLATRMKKLGFRKRARTFWREAQTQGAGASVKAVQLCEIHVGGSPTGSEGVVTARLAVFYPDFVPLLTPWQTKLPAPIKEVDGQIRASLGTLGPWKNKDHSWPVNTQTDDAALAKEFADAVEAHGLPFLEAALDLQKVAAGQVAGTDPFLSVLALQRAGNKDAARARIGEILATKPKEYMAVASFAGRLKLPAPPRPAAT